MECTTPRKLERIVHTYLAADAQGRRTLEIVAGILRAVAAQDAPTTPSTCGFLVPGGVA